MKRKHRQRVSKRRGTILPLVAVSCVVLLGFVALAIDTGRLAVAKAQCQNAADAAAIAGARTLDGTQAACLAAATTNAVAAATPAGPLADAGRVRGLRRTRRPTTTTPPTRSSSRRSRRWPRTTTI